MNNRTDPQHRGKQVSLVLGSGGARGLAHIGVIRWLEEHGYDIRTLVGCSMGACVGGIYAIGKLHEYEGWVRAIRKRDIVSLLDVTLGRGGLVKGDRLFNTLRDLMGDHAIEDLEIPFTAVATDIQRSREVWIKTGPVFDAIRASISVPLLFTPVRLNGQLLVDGGVTNPLPIAPTVGDNTDRVIAVNVSGERHWGPRRVSKTTGQKDDAPGSPGFTEGLQERIAQFVDSLRTNNHAVDEEAISISEVACAAFDTMQSTIARQKLAVYPPDDLIEISRSVATFMEFDCAGELIDLGYQATERVLAE
jgi:NTE family protein